MKITPKSEEELKRFGNLPKGKYPFTVLESDEVQSQSVKNKGRMMFKVKLNVHGPDQDKHVYDYFADWFSEYKLKHFCESAGLAAAYQAGSVEGAHNGFQGRTGFVLIGIENDEKYGEKNVVADYVPRNAPAIPATHATPPEDDSVPF